MEIGKSNVKDIHISVKGTKVWGYCDCGREVNLKNKVCPLCENELIWPDFKAEK